MSAILIAAFIFIWSMQTNGQELSEGIKREPVIDVRRLIKETLETFRRHPGNEFRHENHQQKSKNHRSGMIEPPTVDRLLHLPADIMHGIAQDAGFINENDKNLHSSDGFSLFRTNTNGATESFSLNPSNDAINNNADSISNYNDRSQKSPVIELLGNPKIAMKTIYKNGKMTSIPILVIPHSKKSSMQIPFEKFSDLSIVLSKLVASGKIAFSDLPAYTQSELSRSPLMPGDKTNLLGMVNRPNINTILDSYFAKNQQTLPQSVILAMQKILLTSTTTPTTTTPVAELELKSGNIEELENMKKKTTLVKTESFVQEFEEGKVDGDTVGHSENILQMTPPTTKLDTTATSRIMQREFTMAKSVSSSPRRPLFMEIQKSSPRASSVPIHRPMHGPIPLPLMRLMDSVESSHKDEDSRFEQHAPLPPSDNATQTPIKNLPIKSIVYGEMKETRLKPLTNSLDTTSKTGSNKHSKFLSSEHPVHVTTKFALPNLPSTTTNEGIRWPDKLTTDQQCRGIRTLARRYGALDFGYFVRNNCKFLSKHYSILSCKNIDEILAECYRW